MFFLPNARTGIFLAKRFFMKKDDFLINNAIECSFDLPRY